MYKTEQLLHDVKKHCLICTRGPITTIHVQEMSLKVNRTNEPDTLSLNAGRRI